MIKFVCMGVDPLRRGRENNGRVRARGGREEERGEGRERGKREGGVYPCLETNSHELSMIVAVPDTSS